MTEPALTRDESIVRCRDSRAATDALLGMLRQGRWSRRAGARFLALATRRSIRQAGARPRALSQITVLHGAALALSRGRGRMWPAASWALAVTHLGLLEDRDRLSSADVLTLCRGLLPALAEGGGRWVGLAAIVSDVADGRLARRTGTASPFGAYADTFADAAFWTWLVMRHEPDRRWRMAALAAWAVPVAAVATISAARGRMVEAPRPALLRPVAAMQAVVAVRRLLDRPRPAR